MLNQILDDKENHFRADIDKMPRLHSNNTNSNCEGTILTAIVKGQRKKISIKQTGD